MRTDTLFPGKTVHLMFKNRKTGAYPVSLPRRAHIPGPGLLALALIAVVGLTHPTAGESQSFDAWNQYLGGADSAQYSSLDQIDRSNVDRLEVVWTYPTGDDNQYLFNPIVVDGVMIVQARNNSLVALDAESGREIWVHPFEGAVTTRGVNYWESDDGADRRIFTVNAGFLTALDMGTGQTVTSFGNNGRVDLRLGMDDRDASSNGPVHTNNPGRIWVDPDGEDIVIMPLMRSGADYAYLPGDIHAYYARTGELAWIFHTIPRPGEFGYDTWPDGVWEYAGGAMNWNALSMDTERGIAYIPLSTAKFDYYGGNRLGRNLYGNSLVALDARTGERLWHYQTIHHDLWDYDLPSAPKLLTLQHDGRPVDAVAQPTKHGFLFVFDRVTGEPLWPIEERPVPASDIPDEEAWPTQPFPTRPAPFARQSFTTGQINPLLPATEQENLRARMEGMRNEGLFTPPSLEGTVTLPGTGGGSNWGRTAVDPSEGMLYIVSQDTPTRIRLAHPDDPNARRRAAIAVPAAPGAPDSFVHYFEVVNDFSSETTRLPVIAPPWSTMTAYDLNTGDIVWQVPYGTVPELVAQGIPPTGVIGQRGGPVATAGGLLFAATNDRKFRAYDRDNGAVIWETDLPAASEGVPAVYELGGRQYIALSVAAGNSPVVGRPQQETQPAPGAYMVFALPE